MFFPFLFNRLHEQLQSFVEKKKLLFQVVKEREVGVAHRLLLLSHFHLVQRVPFVQNRPHFNLSDDCCLILSLFAVGVLAAVFFLLSGFTYLRRCGCCALRCSWQWLCEFVEYGVGEGEGFVVLWQ